MKRVNAVWIVGVIFGLIGLVFTVMGAVFLAVSSDVLPAVLTAEVWVGETPDELALPVIGAVFALIGVVFVGIGVVLLHTCRRQRLQREELLRFGTRVTGTVADIGIDRSVRVNGRSPLRIMVQVQHPHTGMTQILRGPSVWETSLSVGDPMEVLFDPQDEKKYVVLLPGETV